MTEEERYCHERLDLLRREYEKDAKPIIDLLVSINAMKPPQPLWFTLDQFADLGFTVSEVKGDKP
jgi:hypothetical protein